MQEARKKLQNKPRRRKRRRMRKEEEEKEEGRKGKHNIMSEIRETECRNNKTLSWFLEKVAKYTNSI